MYLRTLLPAFFSLFLLNCSSDNGAEDDSALFGDSENQNAQANCDGSASIFAIDLDPAGCTVDIESVLGTSSRYSDAVSGEVRTISINGIASHRVGEFPNGGNPHTIGVSDENYTVNSNPQLAASTSSGQGYTFGILFSGVSLDPYTAEFFVGSDGSINMAWNITTLQSETDLGLDCNNAHVQPTGRYHYHGTPSRYIADTGIADGSQMIKVGYAADGFPIYYKYAYAADGETIIALESGYRLKLEDRGGDGVSAPMGCPDGYYFQDYEYVEGLSELDACNGRMGKTPEAESEYYYLITDNFPSSPLCFSGTPDNSFRIN